MAQKNARPKEAAARAGGASTSPSTELAQDAGAVGGGVLAQPTPAHERPAQKPKIRDHDIDAPRFGAKHAISRGSLACASDPHAAARGEHVAHTLRPFRDDGITGSPEDCLQADLDALVRAFSFSRSTIDCGR